MSIVDTDTIAAIATAPGKGSVGIVRISGKKSRDIAESICHKKLEPRQATFCNFSDGQDCIDQGIALYFPAPASFTGEDVVELQGHGGPVVMAILLETVLKHGVRQARPGEFSERAFLNNKIDLAQAEAIADLIDSSSRQAARNALHSLQGQFSHAIENLSESVINLRMYVEAAIDFPEEEIDFLADGHIAGQLSVISQTLTQILHQASQGAAMRDGLRIVIAGKPNAGKSSLLNALSGMETAIVTDIAGTTRDVLRELIHIDGMPLHIIDTAGLRKSHDPVEQEGIRRAWLEIDKADVVLIVVDSTEMQAGSAETLWHDMTERPLPPCKHIIIHNKIDQSLLPPGTQVFPASGETYINISAHTGAGLDALKSLLKTIAGLDNNNEGIFSARSRHVDALRRAKDLLAESIERFLRQGAGELLAEDLRLIHQYLGEITGQYTADDLLGRIFASFCIGK